MRRPIAIDLFAGAGGLSLGFEQAGFDVVAAVEIDPVHAAVHKFNFPNCATLARSIVDTDAALLRREAGIGEADVDVVCGGAPCQGFSLIGHRALDDPRNSLVREYLRIVGEVRPKYFVFENVKGLTVGRHKAILEEFIAEASAMGYAVALPWQVLNARNFAVPQDRERLFLLGARNGLPMPTYPRASAETVTCKDALSDLPDADDFEELLETDECRVSGRPQLSPYAQAMRCEGADGWGFGYPRRWDTALLTSSMRTAHSDISRRRFAETVPGQVEPISRFFKLAPDGVSNTLRAGTDSARGAFTSPRPIHYRHARCVTVREMARLHSFPDWFRFHETKWHGAREIGNAVPPRLARAIAGQLMASLGVTPKRPTGEIELGPARLLRLHLSEASAYWRIDNPIGRRDRKSGAKKRKQSEIEAERLRSTVANA